MECKCDCFISEEIISKTDNKNIITSKYDMIDMEEAYKRIQSYFKNFNLTQKIININTSNSIGHVSSEDVYSGIDLPKYKTSMMDGYAVNFSKLDLENQVKVQNSIYADSNENYSSNNINQCAYVTTGSKIPDIYDTVIPIEFAEQIQYNEIIKFIPLTKDKIKENMFVRQIGSDVKKCELVLAKNKKINVNDLGLLFSLDIFNINVFKFPVIAIASTGDELIDPFEIKTSSENKIIDTNRIMIENLIKKEHANIIMKNYGIIKDNIKSVQSLFERAHEDNVDFLITSGGVSMGEKDLIKKYLEENGKIIFGRLNMKPGKPTTFGRYKNVTVFGLPGNPVSCNVCFYLIVSYAINLFQNLESKFPYSKINAKLMHDVSLDKERPEFSRGM